MIVVKDLNDVNRQPVEIDGATNTTKRLLLGRSDGVPLFSVRMFEIDVDGCSPFHSHDFEHEIYILDGSGKLVTDNGEFELKKGLVIFIPPMEKHQLVNTGTGLLNFLCMVPKEFE